MQKGPRGRQEREEEARDERKRKAGGKAAESGRLGPGRGGARGYASTVRPVDDCQYSTRIRLARTIQRGRGSAAKCSIKSHSRTQALFGKTDRTSESGRGDEWRVLRKIATTLKSNYVHQEGDSPFLETRERNTKGPRRTL